MAELCSDSAITKGQIAYFSLRMRETGHISTFGQTSDVTIIFPDPDFPYDAGIFAICEHLRQAFFIFALIFRTSGPKVAILGVK